MNVFRLPLPLRPGKSLAPLSAGSVAAGAGPGFASAGGSARGGSSGTGRDALVMINANYSSWHHPLPAGTYKVHINDGVVHSDPKAQEINKKLVVPPLRLAVVEHIN